MRILVLGAGAVGGYFGGRLIEGGGAEEVAFLVRPARKARLERDGLAIESPQGDFRARVRALLPEEAGTGWDVVLLSCKAYDLDDAIAALRPALGPRTGIVPLLNGMTHIATLQAAFGEERVLGGLARIFAALTPEGVVRHHGGHASVAFGELDGTMSERVRALAAAFAKAPAAEGEASANIRQLLWDKLVLLHTVAAATVLMRANVGEIARAPGGIAWMERLLERNAAIAAAEGFPVRPEVLERQIRPMFRNPQARNQASMLHDLESGGRIEADHILGFMLEAARRAGVDDALHETAYIHAKAYENRRDAGRLPARA
ncbi:ketopantoate reductase family protein [Caldovatus aquaticus]|uniref:2-dehydropantoate 2-reductase n=1 Tax=Caldovatus aquaticus TaxID=2865671 RepID=A0ABS7F6W4_9PROT|nr:ketopantoate reductase family protein [Caldovatus aquaticus]MBW8271350.1 ketopantoate reductase family protein [Caldovatus aquaticus]